MKLKVFIGAAFWSVLITLLHVQLNVGWGALADKAKVAFGSKRAELVVGFLPVT